MRPPQLILLLVCLVFVPLFITTVVRQTASPENAATSEYRRSYSSKAGRLRDLFFHAPSSLFPPSALISLTDDNSTFFLARPAAFGPPLPSSGLDGQLWIGSGFGDDVSKKGGITTKAEGELGCSDVPGWQEGDRTAQSGSGGRLGTDKTTTQVKPGIRVGEDPAINIQKGTNTVSPEDNLKNSGSPTKNDGTDDHLHRSLGDSLSPSFNDAKGKNKQPTHADIQSLQESAEISGKIVLLSRGGCGFLEKTKWVQRRGGIALIVGDNESGGGLVTMYAHGDTSNVTIPAVFTSHTTAHLLSSLIPSDKGQGPNSPGNKLKAPNSGNQNKKTSSSVGKTSIVAPPSKSTKPTQSKAKDTPSSDGGFFSSIFSFWNDKSVHEDSSRPPSSGNIDWISQNRKPDSQTPPKPGQGSNRQDKEKGTAPVQAKPDPHQNREDDFVIGVQDWRDPDLIVKPTTTTTSKPQPTSQNGNSNSKDGSGTDTKGFKGGSITPGSGEYAHQDKFTQVKGGSNGSHKQSLNSQSGSGNTGKKGHWWTRIFGWGEASDDKNTAFSNGHIGIQNGRGSHNDHGHHGDKEPEKHEGLWVTLAPTSMSTSPFFDTLLVLVVSPLITLTVVYALLLLRSRIRRRRWRAPKAIVDQLPVRTYHTITSSSNSSTPPRTAVPDSASPSSPLLARSESRAQFSTNAGAAASSSLPNMMGFSGSAEKSNAGSTLWRRKYTGRQVECVVCLEEYVDGQSKVMSLPCGHEFHAECITPWLTTRRRTCPICKGDVVRSLGNQGPNDYGSASLDPSPSFDQARAVEDHSGFPSSAIPIPEHENADSELERGALLGDALNASHRSTWRGLTSLSLSALSGDSMWHQVRHTRSQRNR
ncbi:PA domain-containing protein [Nannizzia gypsea CBS 118893]|uniref:RING-type E3 ubiquitin transferase n=1 Tax=Arthroderma gypseum (strain ATCC MYA-4604 / CBS 118893) TaxID=535722 RepID=E5R067_ARTGP|nr:PA domain-containing protein [Nannizzia gypsea CBS 118893]EFQ97478.1 PA domain-containing protein [Nannizzia gypsea CBS 118893]